MFLVIVVVQLLSHVQLFVTPWTAALQAFLSFTMSQNLLKLKSIESVMPSNRLILCCPLLLLPSIFPSIRVFSNEPVLHIRWPKYWSFNYSIGLSNEYSRVDFFYDWLVWSPCSPTRSLKSLLQHHSSKASILWYSAFFMVQLSHPYMTTGKTIALTVWTFVGKVMSLLFNALSRFVIASQFSSVQSLSRVRLFATPWIAARQASLSITISGSSLRLTSIESVMPSSHLILCRHLLLLPPIPPSIRVFSNESTLCMR